MTLSFLNMLGFTLQMPTGLVANIAKQSTNSKVIFATLVAKTKFQIWVAFERALIA
ncbi:hypothetical protein [Campylobacter troglodytis]|uniref:hypothetical protein n=1 Tax=Campylobacter troglodytis TaxID=654363 RepID=UPI00163C186C|nr:hypothetical protein [Campylobacter troglodytis]